jgi:hypothetical protein
VRVTCKGTCPARSWSRSNRKSRWTRVTRFERNLRSGTRITISVTRKGYVGKRTVFVIRRGQAPLRSDTCLSPSGGRTQRCSGG